MESKLSGHYRLTPNQQLFIRIFDGNLNEASRIIGVSKPTVSRWLKRSDIRLAIAQRDQAAKKADTLDQRINSAIIDIPTRILTRQERFSWLTKQILDEDNPLAERIRCCELLGKACGDYITNLRLDMGEDLGEMILAGIDRLKQSAMKEDQLAIEDHGEVIELEALPDLSSSE